MRLIIEARLEDVETGATAGETTILAVLERRDRSVAELGLNLAEGRALLGKAQSALVSQQVASWISGQMSCCRCGAVLAHKDSRSIVVRTVFGKVELASPRLWACSFATKRGAAAPLGKSAVQGRAPASHTGIGVPSGQVGRSSSLPAGHGLARGGSPAGQVHLVRPHSAQDPRRRQGA
jgi:hypothetical protein